MSPKKRTAIFLGKGFTTKYGSKVIIEHVEGNTLTLSQGGLIIGRFERCFVREITDPLTKHAGICYTYNRRELRTNEN